MDNDIFKKLKGKRQKKYADKHREYYRRKSKEFYLKYKLKYKSNGYYRNKRKEYSKRHPEQIKAQNFANNNNLKSDCCMICGNIENLEAHHFDYSQPDNIYTFCRKHHNEVHNATIQV